MAIGVSHTHYWYMYFNKISIHYLYTNAIQSHIDNQHAKNSHSISPHKTTTLQPSKHLFPSYIFISIGLKPHANLYTVLSILPHILALSQSHMRPSNKINNTLTLTTSFPIIYFYINRIKTTR